MPRQILTIELDGLTAGDYLAHLSDPEPPALGFALRSIAVRAEPLGDTVEVTLVWDGRVPAPSVAARAAGLPVVAEVAALRELRAVPLPEAPAAEAVPAPAPPTPSARPKPAPGRLSAFVERAAAQLIAQARPAPEQPLLLRWA